MDKVMNSGDTETKSQESINVFAQLQILYPDANYEQLLAAHLKMIIPNKKVARATPQNDS